MTNSTLNFQVQVRNNVRFMLAACAELTDSTLYRLDGQRGNLLMAVRYGLDFPGTVDETGKLMAAVYPLIERRGYAQSWIPVMRRAITRINDELLRLRLQSQLGNLLTLERKLDDAVQLLTETVHSPLIDQDVQLAARTHFRLGTAYFEKGNLSRAEEHARQALSCFYASQSESSPPLHMGLLSNLLGQISQQRGRHDQAIQFFEDALYYFQKSGDLTYLAGAHVNLGKSKQALNALDETIACYKEALSLLEGTTSEFQVCRVHLALGEVYFSLSDWDQAEEAWQAANSPYLQQSGDAYLLGFVYNNLAEIKIKREEWPAAMTLLSEANRLWDECQADLYRGNLLETMARIYEIQNEWEKALTACNQAQRLLAKFPDHAWARKRLEDLQMRKAGILTKIDARSYSG